MDRTKYLHLLALPSVLLMVLTSCQTKTVVPIPPPSPEEDSGKQTEQKDPEGLKLMSFNIRYKTNNDTGEHYWDNRVPAIREMLNTQKPDLMGVQECLKVQRDDILAGCKDYGVIGVGRDGGENGEMMAIFYRKADITIEKWGTFWLSTTPDVPSKDWNSACNRCATWAIILVKSTGKKIFYVNTHLDHVAGQAQQMAVVEEKMAELNADNLPMFLTADFNVKEDNSLFNHVQTYMYNARKTAPITDAIKSYNSWGKTGSASNIDIIFYSKTGVKALKFKTVTTSYAKVELISDHYPIYGIFEL